MKRDTPIIYSIRILSVLLMLVYLVLLVLSFNLKGYVNQATKEFSIAYLETEIDKQLESLEDIGAISAVTGLLDQIIPGVTGDGKLLKKKFRDAAEKIFSKDRIDEKAMNVFYKEHKADYRTFDAVQAMKERHYMTNWIKVRYISTKRGLLRNVRTNLACNMLVFLAIFLISLFKPGTGLIYPLLVMIVVSVIGSAVYVKNQDWILKILKQDLTGSAYLLFYAAMLIWIIYPTFTSMMKKDRSGALLT